MALPSEGEAADAVPADVDPEAIHRARFALRARLGPALRPRLAKTLCRNGYPPCLRGG